MKQILYASLNARTDGRPADVEGILETSRHNNAIDGITGLLWTDGQRFLQVIEGGDEAVDLCFARIRADDRHRNILVLASRSVDNREFGYWTMEHRRRNDPADEHDWRVRRMLERASPEIKEPFLALVSMGADA